MTRLLLAVIAMIAAFLDPVWAQQTDAPDAAPRPVKLIPIESSEVAFNRQFFGRVAAKRAVDVSFQTGGELMTIPVIEGQEIAAGALVAELDLDPFERALARAEVSLAQARRDAERSAKLQAARTVSEAQAQTAQTQADLAEIALRDARAALEDATIHAPFDALVATRNVEPGTNISPGMAVARLMDLSELRIRIDVPEILVSSRHSESLPEFHATFPGSDLLYPLEMREFKAEASQVGQTYRLTLAMTPPEGTSILPGASATVHVRIIDEEKGVLLPRSAIRVNADGSFSAMVFDSTDGETGQVRSVPVTVSPMDDARAFRVEGLPETGEVVAAGVSLLTDGASVRRFSGFGD
ncbi:MAG: efflux RND transporter periplasmic adaptor subunit [Pelagimonas sp.]|jgi:RND family efflux transporter MFP subunit|nr:efflux RND transporter periplasmic adaptor subunit [Pelagimonas sp.]